MTESEAASATEAGREVADRLLATHGPTLHGYVVAMLGPRDATEVFVSLFDYVEEQHAGLADASEEDARLSLHAVIYNRCIEHARSKGDRPVEDALVGEERRVMEVLAQLKPVGRDAIVRRVVAGTRWSELQRICGVPGKRMHMRTCRALRRVASFDGLPEGEASTVEPSSAESEDGWQWSAIRRSAAVLVAFRSTLRRVCERWATPPEPWRTEIWARLDERREARRRAVEAAEAPSPEPEAVESSEPEPQDDAGVDAPAVVEPTLGSPSSPRPVEPQSASPMTARMIGLVLALGALALLWISMR